jgi:formylglycine-generating enzyme required for sulfatase activity
MQAIPAGTFQMGDTFGDVLFRDELPVHAVTLSAFELARFELTFEEYDLYCDSTGVKKPNDRSWGRGRRPVININWFDAVKYCNWLSEQHGYTAVYRIAGEEVTANWFANGYRLPTEAEWEYAARSGGKQHRFGNGKDTLRSTEANFNASPEYVKAYSKPGEYREKTTTVGSFGRNGSGLADMSGNVLEWCWDRYGADYYEKSSSSNPKGPGEGAYRVIRGGSWDDNPAICRAAFRLDGEPTIRSNGVGFRLARSSRQGE